MKKRSTNERGMTMATLTELVRNMSRLVEKLGEFESRFGIKSPEFYTAMMAGELEAYDALDEYRMDFIKWLALYKTWLSLDEKYQQLIARQPVALHLKTNLALTHA
jgi:hypothetical protein